MFDRPGGEALQRARSALRLAELRTGVRSQVEASVRTPPPSSRLVDVLPGRAVPRGAVTVVTGSAGLLTWIVGETQHDEWVAVVGWPDLGAVWMQDAGIDLQRTLLVPEVQGRGAEIVAALLDGFEQVVVGPRVALNAAGRRQLLARARQRESALITPLAWEGASIRMTAAATWSGPARGDYWLRRARYDVVSANRQDGGRERRFVIERVWQGGFAADDGPLVRVQEMVSDMGSRPAFGRAV